MGHTRRAFAALAVGGVSGCLGFIEAGAAEDADVRIVNESDEARTVTVSIVRQGEDTPTFSVQEALSAGERIIYPNPISRGGTYDVSARANGVTETFEWWVTDADAERDRDALRIAVDGGVRIRTVDPGTADG